MMPAQPACAAGTGGKERAAPGGPISPYQSLPSCLTWVAGQALSFPQRSLSRPLWETPGERASLRAGTHYAPSLVSLACRFPKHKT